MVFDSSLLSTYLVKKDTPRTSFLEVMSFVNFCISNKLYPFIPRKTLVTENEIDSLWIPSIPQNTTFHAVYDNKIVGSATVFGNINSTAYKHAEKRDRYPLGMMVDNRLDFSNKIEYFLIKAINDSKIPFYDVIPVEDKDLTATYRFFLLSEEYSFDQRFKDIGLSGDCIKFSRLI